MIQGIASLSPQPSLGFENLARFGPQAAKPDSGQRANAASGSAASSLAELTPDQQRQVDQLRNVDRKVHAHEQAHLAAGSDLVLGGPSYSYQVGPDNKRYAVAGEVSIDTSPGRTPAETIPKAQHIRAAALAPMDPSAQDRSVAAKAGRMENDARSELAIEQRQQKSAAGGASSGTSGLYGAQGASVGGQSGLGSSLDLFA